MIQVIVLGCKRNINKLLKGTCQIFSNKPGVKKETYRKKQTKIIVDGIVNSKKLNLAVWLVDKIFNQNMRQEYSLRA